ncbi:hypothetical protein WISP_04234 [Willisornis vidua]|uniref:DOP2 protein n=1 Tax=Willisornis vidua TaxID=1566151 RepID=A0ABQ9DTJ6_9PASS|nr:hypothetical protein WISP_04234 [Willisornis vidua]
MVSSSALGGCSQPLQQKFRSDTITEEELVQLMNKFVEDTKKGVHDKEGWPNTAYGVSKIGVTVLSRIQARLLNEERKGDHILLNACCPGWVRTDMAGPRATKSPDEGAETPVYLALLPSDADAPHGQFALQSNLKYSLLPRRLIISKRLSQCLHPALPSGVHLKALETYEIIFKIIGTKWLAKDLFLYSSGLFPLLANAAMSVRPVLLGLYEKYFLPLQKSLLPGLQAFVIGLLPGLEEGSEIYDRRLDKKASEGGKMIKSLCVSVLDSNVLVQRNTLEAILFFFPFYTALDCSESTILLQRAELIHILAAATQTLLRRDMSLNRRLYAWLLGPQVVGDLFLEVIRAFYSYCKDALGSDLKLSYNQSGNILASAIKENKNASEIVKTVNLLITSLSTDFLWDYMTRCFEDCFRNKSTEMRYPLENISTPPTISELCTLLVFLLDVIPLSPVPKEDVDITLETKPVLQQEEEEEEEAPFQPLKSEDSGIGLSASSPELSHHLGLPTVTLERDDVWKKGGSIQKTLHCIQELVAKFSSKYIFGVQFQETSNEGIPAMNPSGKEKKENGYRFPQSASRKKSPWDAKQITVPQFKQMLSDLFSARGSPFRNKGSNPLLSDHDSGNKKEKEEEEWDLEQVMLVLGPLRSDCKEAFSAACHLLLDCTTFPVYLSEEEMEQLYLSLFQVPGCDPSLPLWLRALMTICCCVNDCYVQNVSIFTLLEVINHSQSLALVMEDRMKRSKVSSHSHSPFLGKLQMVTLPPIAPAVLRMIAEKTDFYQRVACVLWKQLNKETREHHIPCVELFYRLHCLAPSANICEDIICHALLDRDKGTRLEALFRFSVMWHLTREIQGSRVTSHNRSFDRVCGPACRNPDFIRDWLCEKKAPLKESGISESNSEENLPLSQFTTVDREAIWAEVEKDPEKPELKPEQPENDCPWNPRSSQGAEGDQDNSEHTESADTSTGHDSENTSSFSPSLELQEVSHEDTDGREPPDPRNVANAFLSDSSRSSAAPNLVRADSERTQASESLSSDEEVDLELQEITHSRLLKQQKEKQEMVEALFKHMLLYLQPYDSRRVLYAFSVLEAVLKTNPKEFIEAVASTSMDTSSTAHLNLIYNLLARHQEALVGQSFYGKLQPQSPTMCPHSLLIELLTYLCLSFLRSYYPCCLKVSHRDVLGNRDVQVKSVEVLIRVMTQLATMAKAAESKSVEFIRSLLGRCKVQEFVLLSLSASMYISQKRYELLLADGASHVAEEELLEESLINFGHDQIWSEHPLQIELLKLLQVLIVLEHHLGQSPEEQENQPDLSKEWQQALNFQQAIGAMQYVYPHPITSQGLFVSAVVRGLQPEYGYGMHPTWVGLVTCSLPYFGKSLGWTVAPFVVQICKNLDELVKQYENEAVKASAKTSASLTSKRENVTPDYPLTLLEGLTTIGHFCLLDHPNLTKKSSLAEPANLRNARNAILEELPRIINTMSLLWSVIKREDSQKRPTDFFGTTKGSSSVYFKATKTLRMKILDFLNPLTAQLGVQLMAAIASVWNSKKPHRSQSKTKILPVATSSQLILVDLVCALNTLKIDTILHLVKEVVKKPAQIKGEEEVTQKILEAVGTVAGSSLEQTSWLSRNLEVKAQPQILPDDFNMEDVNVSKPFPSLQSAYNIPSFRAGAQLLSSLSGYAYTKRAWKKEVLELYMDPSFFQMDTSCTHWRSIIDHLLTHEKTMFKDLMTMQSSALKLYPSAEQKAMLLKRQAFAIFSGESDQYHLYLPLIQERLTENLRVGQTSLVAAQMFLFFRVLLLRISPQHLTSLWPIMVTELIQTFLQLEEDLTEEEEPSKSSSKVSRQRGDSSGAEIQPSELSLYLSACKFLDTALSFPPDRMHLFQMYKWAFVPEVDTESCPVPPHLLENHQECRPHIVRIMDLLKMKYKEPNSSEGIPKRPRFPLLSLRSISSITQLMPFFQTLCWAFTATRSESQNSHPSPAASMDSVGSSTKILQQLEDSVECDFLENMES